jgi:manganese/zinc/iron transport system permease protein
LESPLLILGAAAMGVITVSLVELLNKTKLVKQDAAIGLVFRRCSAWPSSSFRAMPGGVHLDVDAVLLGELAFAPFDRFAVRA